MKPRRPAKVIVCLFAAGVLFFGGGCQKQSEPNSTQAPSSETTTNAVAAGTGAVRVEFQKLAGRWERPDGGYVLEVRSVAPDGRMEAGYFNPGPIHVSKALAIQEGETTKVFVELKDVNYPGCTYSLSYDPKTDQLFGQYFQAALQQAFDVAFARLKE